MREHPKEAPIFADSLATAEWILRHTNDGQDTLSRTMAAAAVELIELVALALSGRDKVERLHVLDDLLVRLRMYARLAVSLQHLNERQGLHLIERLDQIGHQLGGWLRRLRNPSGSGRQGRVPSGR